MPQLPATKRITGGIWLCAMCLMIVTLLAGCGGGGDGDSKKVQALRIEQAQFDVVFFCSSGRNDLYGAADPLGTMLTAVDNLIRIYRDDPDATYRMAKVLRTGDKVGIQDFKVRSLLERTLRRLEKGCGQYGRDQARRLQDALRAS